jgi:putative transposase
VRKPQFKKKGRRDGFRADPGTDATRPQAVNVGGKVLHLPRIGWVQMREDVRFAGKILSCTVSLQGNAWFASLCIQAPYEVDPRAESTVVGVDLGVSALATLSDGTTIAAPRPLGRYLKKLRRLSRALSRKERRSRNRAKAKAKLARLHRRISDIRADALHKLNHLAGRALQDHRD